MISKISDVSRVRCCDYCPAATHGRNDHVSVRKIFGSEASDAKQRANFLGNGKIGVEYLDTSDLISRKPSQKRLDGPGARGIAAHLSTDHSRNNNAARATPGTFDKHPKPSLFWRRPS